ncbi:MAG: AAA family ATPase [Candidatus Saccharimonadales bacterium]|jgi:dephospho-CoA kinase
MSKYLITGVAGTGKSSVAKELQKRGYAAYDTEVGFSYYVNKNSGERAVRPTHPKLKWYEEHERVFNEQVLNNIFKKHSDEPLFICSITANQKKYYPSFDKIFLLTSPDELLAKRIHSRTDNHFGKHPLELARVISRHQAFDDELKAAGAIVIDSTQSITKVVDQILESMG